MKDLLKIAVSVFMFSGIFSAHSVMIDNAPFISFFDTPDRVVGAKGTAEVVKVTMPWLITSNNMTQAKRSALAMHTYWCTDDGLNCTSDSSNSIVYSNILVRASDCPNATTPTELLQCMFSLIQPGSYEFTVQAIISNQPYRRPQVCLRMLDLETPIAGSWATSNQSCRLGNISNVWCAMVTPELTFDFGTMHVSEANNKNKEDDLRVYCNGVTNYKIISSAGSSMIDLGNGMTAKIQLNGDELGKTLNSVNSADSEEMYKISVTLQGNPTSTGPFNSISLLMIDYP
ncbi:MrpH family fimbial adhesin [Enterobacter sp. 22325]|uniref:MrpH family fimbial adhesin n=1 Tax=Enterobacter sp. 22325 TaxID=3453911 RepID=UPI003F86867E